MAQFTEIAVGETDDGDILRHFETGVGQLVDHPVGDLVILADQRGTAGQLFVDEVREKPGVLLFLQQIQLGGCIPADPFIGNQQSGIPHIVLQAMITLYALHIVQFEKTGEPGMSLMEKMLSQLNAAVVVSDFDADSPGQSLLDAVQENKRYVPAVQLLIVIQIGIWQGAFTGFDDQAPGRAAADLLQEFPFLCHLIVCGVHLQ